MGDPVRAFYDELAGEYHLLFADWPASIAYQTGVLARLIPARLGPGVFDVLDCACGIGTQAIGLARLGHRVHATDLSPAAVERLRREATALGLPITTGVADLRSLSDEVAGTYDLVVAFDNALPHILTDDDLGRAARGIAVKLRPGGCFLASVRDYDRLATERPRGEGPRVFDGPDGRRIAFQVWDWAEDGSAYEVHQFIVRQAEDGWRTDHFAAPYRALPRAELTAVLAGAGLTEITWLEPETTGFYQPIVSARKPS